MDSKGLKLLPLVS